MSLDSRSLSLVVVESLTSAAVVMFAIIGNAILLFALCRKPRSKNSTLVLVGSLALVDFLFTSTTAPLFVLSLATVRLASNNLGCQLIGFLIHTLSKASILIMTLTAISRYYCVLKPDVYRRLFTFRRTICYNVLVWIFVTSEFFVFVGFGQAKIAFNPLAGSCLMVFQNQNSQVTFTLYAAFFYILLCFSIICFCYNRVSRFIRQHNANIASLTTQEINLTRALFVLMLAFVILWVPFYIIIILYRMILAASRFPREMAVTAGYLNYISCAINPWIYGVMSPLVRNKMKRVFFRSRPLLRVSPGAANTTTSRACALRSKRLEESNIQYETRQGIVNP